ncbi:MAG: tRNA pseudouridine(38-40) synthase TruA [Firmicutes bacterium]|nr:tRNA pseudouridine(38-40) synthase TruA [Bacillota bacterium]
MRYLVELSYDGSNFNGFQRLNDERSVQAELEHALSIINKADVEVKGAGRTDKGVHALGQRAHFDLDVDVPIDRLKTALNDILPGDIRIISIEKVTQDFHARFNVTKKVYEYKINTGEYDVFKNNYYYQYKYDFNIDILKEVASLFIGVHNFKNFVSGERDNYEAIIYNIDINKDNDIITITFEGKSFYRYMVRNLVGAMLDVARGKATIDDVKNMLDNYDIDKHLSCAPANGLYLNKIYY